MSQRGSARRSESTKLSFVLSYMMRVSVGVLVIAVVGLLLVVAVIGIVVVDVVVDVTVGVGVVLVGNVKLSWISSGVMSSVWSCCCCC